MSEKLCLQWNDFKANVNSAIGRLRDDKEFTDVTLACEDGQQVDAHKVVLIASSPFFLNILKRKNDRPGDDGTLRRVIFGSIVKNHRIIIIITRRSAGLRPADF